VEVSRVQGDVRRELERRLSPEFRNRIDDVVLFDPLTADDVRDITKKCLLDVERTIAKGGKTIEISDAAVELLATEGHSLAFGARFLKRVIDERIKLPMTMQWQAASHFRVRVAPQGLVVEAVSSTAAAAA
jgi:ATP-dependent Clp protease ATP-binding subunit ClpA